MQMEPSRIEKYHNLLINRAKEGIWSCRTILFSSEINRMKKQWNVNVRILEEMRTPGKYYCEIDWRRAFEKEDITRRQSFYISHIFDEMPAVHTVAQELFLITART